MIVKSIADRLTKNKKKADRATLIVTAVMVSIIAYTIVMPFVLSMF